MDRKREGGGREMEDEGGRGREREGGEGEKGGERAIGM